LDENAAAEGKGEKRRVGRKERRGEGG